MTESSSLDLRQRLLLWHRVLAQMTGTLSLSYGGKGLKRAALQDWSNRLRSVADDMDSIKGVDSSRLDDAGRAVLKSAARTAPLGDETEGATFFSKERGDVTGTMAPATKTPGPAAPKPLRKATRK